MTPRLGWGNGGDLGGVNEVAGVLKDPGVLVQDWARAIQVLGPVKVSARREIIMIMCERELSTCVLSQRLTSKSLI